MAEISLLMSFWRGLSKVQGRVRAGYDAAAIERLSLAEDKDDHPVLGVTYRVKLRSKRTTMSAVSERSSKRTKQGTDKPLQEVSNHSMHLSFMGGGRAADASWRHRRLHFAVAAPPLVFPTVRRHRR